MKRIPKSINLLGKKYKIIQKNLGETDHHGCIDFSKKEIHLEKSLPKDYKMSVLLHEIGHFFTQYYFGESEEIHANSFGRFVHDLMDQLK